MTIFDGVEVKPTLSPTMQGVLSVVTLVANSLLEADRVRETRQTGEGQHSAAPGTLDAVMAQAGLDIPGLQQVLEQLMGGGEGARKAATLIVNNPDPAGLLQRFVEHFSHAEGANAGSTAAPGSAPWAAPAASTAPGSSPPKFRPEFTREARTAARTAASQSASTSPTTSGPRPVNTSTGSPPVVDTRTRSTVTAAAPAPRRSSLVAMVEHQLGLLRNSARDHEVELDGRLTRAETKLAFLRKEFNELVAMRTKMTSPIAERLSASREAAEDLTNADGQRAVELPAGLSAPVLNSTPTNDAPVETASNYSPTADESGGTLLPAASDEEALQTVRLIAEFGDDIEAQHGRQFARVMAIEDEIAMMSTLVQRERETLLSHG